MDPQQRGLLESAYHALENCKSQKVVCTILSFSLNLTSSGNPVVQGRWL